MANTLIAYLCNNPATRNLNPHVARLLNCRSEDILVATSFSPQYCEHYESPQYGYRPLGRLNEIYLHEFESNLEVPPADFDEREVIGVAAHPGDSMISAFYTTYRFLKVDPNHHFVLYLVDLSSPHSRENSPTILNSPSVLGHRSRRYSPVQSPGRHTYSRMSSDHNISPVGSSPSSVTYDHSTAANFDHHLSVGYRSPSSTSFEQYHLGTGPSPSPDLSEIFPQQETLGGLRALDNHHNPSIQADNTDQSPSNVSNGSLFSNSSVQWNTSIQPSVRTQKPQPNSVPKRAPFTT